MSKIDPDLDKITREIFPLLPTQQEVSEFYEALGIATSAWQLVENALFELFQRALEPARPGAAGCAFHTLLFRAKLASVDAAPRFSFLSEPDETKRGELEEEWAKLRKKADKRHGRRSHFAHFQVMTYFSEPSPTRRIRLQPTVLDYRYAVGIVEPIEYTVGDLRNNAESFRALAMKLRAFLGKIPPQKKRPPTSPQPAPGSSDSEPQQPQSHSKLP